jgi:hypothetical protein
LSAGIQPFLLVPPDGMSPQHGTRKVVRCITHVIHCLYRGSRHRSGGGTVLQAGRSRVLDPMMSLKFISLPNPSSCTASKGLLRLLTKMSRRDRLKTVRFEVFTAVTMKNCVFWVVTPCGSCKNRRFGARYRFRHQDDKIQRARNDVSNN